MNANANRTVHFPTISADWDGKHAATCVCGWESTGHPSTDAARAAYDRHLTAAAPKGGGAVPAAVLVNGVTFTRPRGLVAYRVLVWDELVGTTYPDRGAWFTFTTAGALMGEYPTRTAAANALAALAGYRVEGQA
jgi:hypothetical protein